MGSGPHKCSAGMTTVEDVIQGRYLCHSGAAKPSPEPMITSVTRTRDRPVHGFRPSEVFGRNDNGGGCHSGALPLSFRGGEAEPGTHEHLGDADPRPPRSWVPALTSVRPE